MYKFLGKQMLNNMPKTMSNSMLDLCNQFFGSSKPSVTTIIPECSSCGKFASDNIEAEFIVKSGICLTCDHVAGDL